MKTDRDLGWAVSFVSFLPARETLLDIVPDLTHIPEIVSEETTKPLTRSLLTPRIIKPPDKRKNLSQANACL